MTSRLGDTQPEPRGPQIAALCALPLGGIQPGSGNHESSTTRRCRLRQESGPATGVAHRRQTLTYGKMEITTPHDAFRAFAKWIGSRPP